MVQTINYCQPQPLLQHYPHLRPHHARLLSRQCTQVKTRRKWATLYHHLTLSPPECANRLTATTVLSLNQPKCTPAQCLNTLKRNTSTTNLNQLPSPWLLRCSTRTRQTRTCLLLGVEHLGCGLLLALHLTSARFRLARSLISIYRLSLIMGIMIRLHHAVDQTRSTPSTLNLTRCLLLLILETTQDRISSVRNQRVHHRGILRR